MSYEYMTEMRLRALNPQLHSQYRSCIVVAHQMLSQYQCTFPEYTDHTDLHTLEIIDFCNSFIAEQIELLTAEDIYILLMGALFHDVGMGISEKDFYAFRQQHFPEQQELLSREQLQDAVRKSHHEISGWFLKKYWRIFDIPNEAYATAIVQVCRGHRKVDLLDEQEYPAAYPVEEGRVVALPYLAALIRLADELDIAADRNLAFLYDPRQLRSDSARMEFLRHESIRSVEILPDRVLIRAETEDPLVRQSIVETIAKLADVLQYCSRVAAERTVLTIRQEHIELFLNEQHLCF